MANPTTHLRLGTDGVAIIELDYKPLNALHPKRESSEAMQDLWRALQGLQSALQALKQGSRHLLLRLPGVPTSVTTAVLRSLFDSLRRAHEDPSIKGIVVIGANNNFSPGFDIQQFQNQVCAGI